MEGGATGLGEEDVLGLEVAVIEAAVVEVPEGGGELRDAEPQPRGAHRAVGLQHDAEEVPWRGGGEGGGWEEGWAGGEWDGVAWGRGGGEDNFFCVYASLVTSKPPGGGGPFIQSSVATVKPRR